METITSYQIKLIKMRAELANLNHCAVPFLNRAAVNLCWYYDTTRIRTHVTHYSSCLTYFISFTVVKILHAFITAPIGKTARYDS